MASPRSIRRRLLAAALSALAGALAMLAGRGVPGPTRVAVAGTVDEDRGSFEHRFARPAFLPAPSDNLPTADKVALGRRLFADPLLSANGKIACATCHDPKLAFADGVPVGAGITGRPLSRHTPTLWNLAWSPTQFWDGRAASLEEQARGPIEHPDEMGSRLDEIVERLRPHSAYAGLTQNEVHLGKTRPSASRGRATYFDGRFRW